MHTKKTLLIVDDEPGIRHYFTMALETPTLAVDSRGTLQDAQHYLTQHDVDAVITDVSLRGSSGSEGLDVATLVRKEHPKASVVLMSNRSPDEMEELAKSCGADMWLKKPVRLRCLRKTLQRLGFKVSGPGATLPVDDEDAPC